MLSALLLLAATQATDLRTHYFYSEVFKNTRHIRVLLPREYESRPNKRYPVLYLADGQNLFGTTEGRDWKVDETVEALLAEQAIELLIVVGVDNAGRFGRAVEYLPYQDEFYNPPLKEVKGELYPRFMEEVMLFVNQNYRTKRGREDTAIGGSSYGALISLYTACRLPNLFGKLLLESPSLYVANKSILKERLPRKLTRVYIGLGDAESPEESTRELIGADSKALVALLDRQGLAGSKIKLVIQKGAQHNESAWSQRLPAALRFLFPRR